MTLQNRPKNKLTRLILVAGLEQPTLVAFGHVKTFTGKYDKQFGKRCAVNNICLKIPRTFV